MEEEEVTPRPRRQRPKDSFQKELQAKLKDRKSRGLAVDFSDNSDDGDDLLGSYMNDYKTSHPDRPSTAKRRPNHSTDLRQGLGTKTMHTKDLSHILGRSLSDDDSDDDDDDEEIVAADLGKTNHAESWNSKTRTPSPKPGSKYLRKNTRNDTAGKQESYGRKTPVRDTSPYSSLSKEDTIFGRKTPIRNTSPYSSLSKEDTTFGRKTPVRDTSPYPSLYKEDTISGRKTPLSDGKKSPGEESQKGGNNRWQPPNFHSVSTRETSQSRGSRGVMSNDSSLDQVSESPKERPTPRIQRSERHKPDEISRHDDRPRPQARGKVADKRSPPVDEHRRTSPSYQKETENKVKRTTPTLDIFGRSRSAAAEEVDEYIQYNKEKEEKTRKTGKNVNQRAKTPDSKQSTGTRETTPSPSVRFMKDNRNTSTDRKTPTGQRTPTSGKQSPLEKKSPEKEKATSAQDSSLLDFLMEDKPKPQERGRRPRRKENQNVVDDIFGNIPKSALQEKFPEGRKTPGSPGRKTPEHGHKSPKTYAQQGDILQKVHVQQKAEDTSSLCDDIPPDPHRKMAGDINKKQTTEKAQADKAIEATAMAQTMQYIEPARRVRPRTASAKVQHRPKPRYGNLAGGTTKSLQELHFNSTGDIRDAVYDDWYREHMHSSRHKKKVDEKKAKEEEEKKKKDAEERHFVAETSYKAWMEKKKKVLAEEHKEKKEKEKMIQENEAKEKEEQKMKSQKLFDSWKSQKDAMIKKELYKKKEEAKRSEDEKKKKKIEEQKERESAHKSWLNRKEQQHIEHLKQKKNDAQKHRNGQDREKEELKRKEISAENYYLNWLEEKEKQAKMEKKKAKQKLETEEFKPAWFPSSHTIPFGR